jgi:transcriptional antiterminator RfaH
MRIADDVLLPLAKVQVRRRSRLVKSVAPLFSCYLFALLDLERQWVRVRYVRGLRNIVHFGGQPSVVPEWIISELKQRCSKGPVELAERRLLKGESVRVVDGPLQNLEGVFDGYLSGPERVAILLSLMGVGARALVPASIVVPAAY